MKHSKYRFKSPLPLSLAVALTLCTTLQAANAQSTLAQCDYGDAALYGGWGWNPITMQSCTPLVTTAGPNETPESATVTGVPVCEFSTSDSDNDGWGWENARTCVVAASSSQAEPEIVNEPPNNALCVDSDGDGWGWNGTSSCLVQAQPADDPQNATSQDTTDSQASCIDTDGDGWGWNGTSSCIVGESGGTDTTDSTTSETIVAGSCAQPASGTTVVSSTGPVRSTGNSFYPDNGPQCVTPANQFNGPGLGFGDFLLLNNAWNGDKSSWNWSQCIALSTASDGSVTPSWTYDWGNEDDLQPGYQEWEVKSYPEIIYGVKAENQESAPCATTGLPVPYNAMPTIDISYNYRAPQTSNRTGDLPDENNTQQTVTGGDRNIAIESFLHSSCEIKRGSESNREFELMVWLQHGNERLPSGSPPVAVYTDNAGRNFDVYVKIPADPGYVAYVAQEQSTSGTINWNEFFADAKTNAETYGIKSINSNWCLANILFGSEIWWGEGSFAMDYLQVKRSY